MIIIIIIIQHLYSAIMSYADTEDCYQVFLLTLAEAFADGEAITKNIHNKYIYTNCAIYNAVLCD